VGVILAFIYRSAASSRYGAIGRSVHDDVDDTTGEDREDWRQAPGVSGLEEAQP
jgi:hypothetical protein